MLPLVSPAEPTDTCDNTPLDSHVTGLCHTPSIRRGLTRSIAKSFYAPHQKYVDKCRIRFSNDIKVGKIELVNQNSASALDLILKKNNDIDVVFLDAHFHGEGQEYAPLDQEIEILRKNNYKKLVIIDDFFHIKKKMAHEWTKFHNHQTIKQKILKNFGKVSELPYSFKGRYISYLISMEFSKARILIEKIKAIILSSPKNLIKIFMGKKLN